MNSVFFFSISGVAPSTKCVGIVSWLKQVNSFTKYLSMLTFLHVSWLLLPFNTLLVKHHFKLVELEYIQNLFPSI